MDPLAFGVSYPFAAPLFPAVDELGLLDRLDGVRAGARRVAVAPWNFDEIKPAVQARPDVPEEAGWSYVVGTDDPDRDAIIAALQPLASRRGMADPAAPLEFPSGADRGDWIEQEYKGLGDGRPRYLLLAGDPTVLPFALQVDLTAAGAMVGRLAFTGDDRMAAYHAYVEKVGRFAGGDPVPRMTATVISTYGGPLDATSYSTRYLAPPVTAFLRDRTFEVLEVAGPAATADGIRGALGSGQPALVFTATHGFGIAEAGADGVEPPAINGAWACAPADRLRPRNAWEPLRATDLPAGPIAPGGLMFQFACFGFGTTDQTSFAAWLGNRNVVETTEPFVSAIPQRLLADPDGPLGYIGHVDIALAYGFVNPSAPPAPGTTDPRIQPYLSVLSKAIAQLTPIGYALRDLQERATSLASELATTFDGLEQQGIEVTDLSTADRARLIDKVIRRNDAMHFLLLGDPAVRVRIDG